MRAAYVLEKCRISAFDAATGKTAWSFNTIAKSGERGGDTWGKNSDYVRAGGETWITAVSIRRPISRTGELLRQNRGCPQPGHDHQRQGAFLKFDRCTPMSIPASLKWYFQHAPAETMDLDIVLRAPYSSIAADRISLFTAGKDGILWKLDRKTGKYLAQQGNRVPERLESLRSV
jgi:alcohol dehydrogenase (cytochrome c)